MKLPLIYRLARVFSALFIVGCFIACGRLYAAKEKNIIKFGRDLTIEKGRTVRGAATVAGGITINGTVEDDVVAVGGSINLGPAAVIGGNVVSVGGIIDKNPKAGVSGNIVEVNVPGITSITQSFAKYRYMRARWILKTVSFVSVLIIALLCVAIIPAPLGTVSEMVERHALRAISWSIRGLLLIVPLAVILTMSVAGIFLIPLEVIIVASSALLGYIAVARVIGKKLLEIGAHAHASMTLEMAAGVTLIGFVGLIPVFGWIVRAIITLIGFGAVIACLFPPKKAH